MHDVNVKISTYFFGRDSVGLVLNRVMKLLGALETQAAIIFSKLTIETIEQGVKYVQS